MKRKLHLERWVGDFHGIWVVACGRYLNEVQSTSLVGQVTCKHCLKVAKKDN